MGYVVCSRVNFNRRRDGETEILQKLLIKQFLSNHIVPLLVPQGMLQDPNHRLLTNYRVRVAASKLASRRRGTQKRPAYGIRRTTVRVPCHRNCSLPMQACMIPRRSKYPIFEASALKDHTLNVFLDQGPQILGTWTLWDEEGMAFIVEHLQAQDLHNPFVAAWNIQ